MKNKFLFLAVLLPVITFSVFAFSEKNVEDDDATLTMLEQEAANIATETMYEDGGPFEEYIKKENHYCYYSKSFMSRRDRLDWIYEMMGPGNSNHVHSIMYSMPSREGCSAMFPGVYDCYSASISVWTSRPCSTIESP